MGNRLHEYVSRDLQCLCDSLLFPRHFRVLKPTIDLCHKAEARDVGREGRLDLSLLRLVG